MTDSHYTELKVLLGNKKINNVEISADALRQKIELLGGNPSAGNIDEAFKKVVAVPKLQRPPGNVVLIIGESMLYGHFY